MMVTLDDAIRRVTAYLDAAGMPADPIAVANIRDDDGNVARGIPSRKLFAADVRVLRDYAVASCAISDLPETEGRS